MSRLSPSRPAVCVNPHSESQPWRTPRGSGSMPTENWRFPLGDIGDGIQYKRLLYSVAGRDDYGHLLGIRPAELSVSHW
jgi:hypothetical protein